MLRYILIKLPGFSCISDVPVSSPCHVRMLRSLSPVKHECRENRRNSDFTKYAYKRSFSYPSDARPKTETIPSRYRRLYSENKLQDTKCEQVIHRKDLSQKAKRSSKKQKDHVEIEKHKEQAKKVLDQSKEFLLAENDIDERFYDTYEASEQYELEAAKPRRSQSELTFNVFELIEKRASTPNPIEHLQPNNLKPFGSMENVQTPTLMKSKSSTLLRFPHGYDENEQYNYEKKSRRAEDIQHREYSTSSKLSLFRLEDHVELIRNLPPIPVSKYGVGSTSNLFETRIDKSKQKQSEENNNVKLDTLKNIPSEGQSETKSRKSFRSPWTNHDFVQLKTKQDHEEVSKEKSKEIIETFKPIETPWPSYSDTLKGRSHNLEMKNYVKSVRSTTEPNLLAVGSDLVGKDMQSSSTEKLQQAGKQIDDKLVRRSNFLQKASTLSQKRTLSTEPVLTRNSLKQSEIATTKTKPVKLLSQENSNVQSKSYSKKSRPLEPKSCSKEKPPDKCFLPSRIRLKPPLCTPKPKPCPKEEPCVRADDCLRIEPKRLPQLTVSSCPCIEPEVPEKNPRLKRLQMKFQDPPRLCPCNPCPCPPRADDDLVEKPKKLMPLKQGDCICVEAHPLVDVPLKRLQKICVPEEKCYPKAECPKEEPCMRADDTLKVCEKPLPKLKVGPCPCVEQTIPDKNPKLRRLKFVFKDTPRVCPCEPTCPCPPRADDNIIEGTKKLPVYIPGDCACVEPAPMVDIPLRRLQKVCIPEEKCYPKEKCPEPEPCVRADDYICEEVKPLPILKPSECVCKEMFVPDKVPKMKRLEMNFKDEPKICPCEPDCPCPPRADDAQPHKTKKLPQLVAGECPCIEAAPLVDVPLKRLQKVCVPEEKCYPTKVCPKPEPCIRADDSICVKSKELPKLEAKVCPCIEEPPLKESPALKRLDLKVPEPPKVCPTSCVCEVDCPRADDRLDERKKPLPILKAGNCPCIDKPMVDVDPLKRLKCEEEEEDCPTVDPCMDNPRADMGCWEYWTAEKNKCKTGEKTQKKTGVTVNTKRKFNTDSRLKLYDEIKKLGPTEGQIETYSTRSEDVNENDISAAEYEDFNRVSNVWKEKNGWVVRKPEAINETPKMQLYKNHLVESTPTVFLLKQLDNDQEKKHKTIALKVGKVKNLDVKGILETNPGLNDQQGPLSLPNVRNLSTDVQVVGVVRSMSTDKKVSKKKKTIVKKKSPCHKIGQTCELNSKLPCVNTKCPKTCDPVRTPVCCDKKPPPYPAFSEIMEEEVEPYSESRQWTCNRREFGFHPRYKRLNNPFSADKDKKNYTTTTLRDNILAVELMEKPKDNPSLKYAPARPNSDPITVPIVKKCRYKACRSDVNPANLANKLDCVSSKNFHSNKKTNFGILGTYSSFPKIFSMNSNSPLSSKPPKRMQPQYNIQIVRGICLDVSKKKCNIIKNVSFRRNSTNSKKEKSKKCDKKKKCPKFKLENCPPAEIRPKCKIEHPVICDKNEAPYPAFTDCLDEELAENLSECPLEIEKVRQLQPKYIQPLDKPNLMKPVTPVLGKIDLKKEEACVREKLCIENKGLSQSCGEFGKFQKQMRAKHFIKVRDKDCDKIDELKKLGKWPPKNSRGMCTSTVNSLFFQKRNVSKFAKKNKFSEEKHEIYEKAEKSKIHTRFVRNYHILCMKPMKKLIEYDNKNNEEQHHVITEDDCCRYKKLRNVQWRINNFQKWHRLNKLSSLPGYVKRFHSDIDMRNRCTNVDHGQKTFSTSATYMVSPCETLDIPMQRGISTTFILAGAKKNEIEYIHVRKDKKKTKVSKSCPKFTFDGNPPRTRLGCSKKKSNKKPLKKQEPPYSAFSDCDRESSGSKTTECPVAREEIKRLQPQYPILPELEIPSPDLTFQGKLDPSLEAEYARQKYGIENVGLTQNCHNFGEKIKPLRVRMALESVRVDNSLDEVSTDHPTFSMVVPEVHPRCSRIAEVPNVHFSSSAEVENITKVNMSQLHMNCSDKVEDNRASKNPSQCIEAKLSQKLELTIPSSYKTCPEPPQDSQITQQCCKEYQGRNKVKECSMKEQTRKTPLPKGCSAPSPRECSCSNSEKTLEKTLWQKIYNYFKARPNCPAPDEWKKKAARAKAEKYAKVAGLVVIDPKELPPKKEKCPSDELPTVITHHSCYSSKKSIASSGRKSFSTTTIIKHHKSEKKMTFWCQNDIIDDVAGYYQRPFQTISDGNIHSSVYNWDNSHYKITSERNEPEYGNKSIEQGHSREKISTSDEQKSDLSLMQHAGSLNVSASSMELNEVMGEFGEKSTEIYEENICSSLGSENYGVREVSHQNINIPEPKVLYRNAGHNGVFLTSLGSASTDDEADDSTSIDETKNLTRCIEINHNDSMNLVTIAHDGGTKIREPVFSTISLDSLDDENNNDEIFENSAEKPKCTNANYNHHLDEINRKLFGTSRVSTVNVGGLKCCATQNLDNMKKGIQITNRQSPFLTVMRRYYSKNARCRNLEEINKSLEEEEKKKKLAKKVGKSFMEGPNVLIEHGYDDISITSQKNSETIEDGDSTKSNVRTEDDVSNRSCNISYKKPGFFEVIFQEPLHGISGYNQAKTFAAFQEYFHKIEVLSDISYEEIERVKTSNLIKELDKLIVDDKKQNRKS